MTGSPGRVFYVPQIPVDLPPGWVCRYKGIPDMTQEGGFWKAVKPHPKATYFLTITWIPRAAKYLCEHQEGDAEVRESRAYNYPHEVVDWIRRWINRLERNLQA